MKFGKTIKLFLIDGDTNGRLTCELSNWTDKAEMEEFLANILTLVSTLGYNAFEQIRQADTKVLPDKEEDLFFITAARGANGIGKTTSEGFVVFENSQVADPVTNSYPRTMQKLRDTLISEGVIVKDKDKMILKRDYLFSSSSSAAMIIMGRSANGLTEWKMKSGKTLQDFETGENN